jgi:hypothetical protein
MTTTKEETQRWLCGNCQTINVEYRPWPVNAECEKCGHAVEFGTAVWVQPDAVVCPQCLGKDEFCMYCNGAYTVTACSAEEWKRQNL